MQRSRSRWESSALMALAAYAHLATSGALMRRRRALSYPLRLAPAEARQAVQGWSRMENTSAGLPSELVDLTRIRLGDLRKLDNSALAQSIRRVLDDVNRQEDPVADFGSAI